jgi:hypothetical protein
LREAGHQVEIHIDHFAHDAPDEVWLAGIAGRNWILLTKDGRIRRRELERQALDRARVHTFFLGNRQLNATEMADAFERAIPRIERLVAAATEPILASIHRDGRVTLVVDSEGK